MKPTFSKNDLIICKEIDDLNKLKEGDVITFWTIIDGRRVKNTHRIVGVNNDEGTMSFITRGDNNPVDDTSPAYASDIIGKWTNTKISGFGKFMSFLRTKKGFFICILIPMALFFLFELYKFIVALIEVKRPEPAEQLDEEEIKRRAIEEYLASKGETADKLAEKAESVKETVSDAAEKLEEKAEAIKDAAKEKASDAAEKLGEKAEALKEETAKELSEIAEKTNDNAG
jgi:signal peptidase